MKSTTLSENEVRRPSIRQLLAALEGILIIVAGYLTFFLKPLRNRWGMKKEETNRDFPGDELVPHPKTKFTHAIEIAAPVEYVWPWIAQLGQGRGGFYSYELLENIAGLNIYNSNKVLPEYQQPRVGDSIPFGAGVNIPLVICQPSKHMVIEYWLDMDTQQHFDPEISQPNNFMHLTWLWAVEPLDENRTRFISRNRVDYSPSLKSKLLFGSLSEPVVFAMDRKMCLGIRKRALQLWAENQDNQRA